MNNIRILLSVTCIYNLILILSCSHIPKNSTVHEGTSNVSKNHIPKTCKEMLTELVKQSSFRSSLVFNYDSIIVELDDVSNDIATIHVSQLNEEGRSITVAWLELNLIDGILKDVTKDPENPVSIQYTYMYLSDIKKNCSK